jgi:hypothetical protein
MIKLNTQPLKPSQVGLPSLSLPPLTQVAADLRAQQSAMYPNAYADGGPVQKRKRVIGGASRPAKPGCTGT